jgi:hypothetical protein
MKPKCNYRNSKGRQCKNTASEGSLLCVYHLKYGNPLRDLDTPFANATSISQPATWNRAAIVIMAALGLVIVGFIYTVPKIPKNPEANAPKAPAIIDPLPAVQDKIVQPVSEKITSEAYSTSASPSAVDVSSAIVQAEPILKIPTKERFISVLGRVNVGTPLYDRWTHRPFGLISALSSNAKKVEVILVDNFTTDTRSYNFKAEWFDRKYITDNYVTPNK